MFFWVLSKNIRKFKGSNNHQYYFLHGVIADDGTGAGSLRIKKHTVCGSLKT